jgi:hydroxypyruvate isomerase
MRTHSPSEALKSSRITRRQMLGRTTALASGLASAGIVHERARAAETPVVTKGRIRQSIVHWCFEVPPTNWTVERTCQVAKELGCPSVELVAAEHYPTLKRYGLTSAIGQIDMSPDQPFVKGWNNRAFWPRVSKATRDTIDAGLAFGVANVIAFTGYSAVDPDDPNSRHLSPEEGAKNCVDGLKGVVGYAEEKGVTLCLEVLNTRDDSHPMKGHPGYQGDHMDYCLDIIKRVGSPRLKLLFDIYHVQVMDGDLIRRIREDHEYIGHVHTAGNPGRGELDDDQEIQYPAVLRALLDAGYEGYVGQEFIPTRDAYTSLREAVRLCDV